MWYSLFLYMIISILIIYIIHQLWIYMTNKYTTKKYLVGSQIEKYKNILRELQEEKPVSNSIQEIPPGEPIITILHDSKNDLEEFMKEIL